MKRTALIALMFGLAAFAVHAVTTVPLGQAQVPISPATGQLQNIPVYQVNSSGTPMPTPAASSASYSAQLTASAGTYLNVSNTFRTVSNSDVPVNLSTLAGTATGLAYSITFGSTGPCTEGLLWCVDNSASAPNAASYQSLDISKTALVDEQGSGAVAHFKRGLSTDCSTAIQVGVKR